MGDIHTVRNMVAEQKRKVWCKYTDSVALAGRWYLKPEVCLTSFGRPQDEKEMGMGHHGIPITQTMASC